MSHSTRKPLNGIDKGVTPDPEDKNIVYKFKYHCDSEKKYRENISKITYKKRLTCNKCTQKLNGKKET